MTHLTPSMSAAAALILGIALLAKPAHAADDCENPDYDEVCDETRPTSVGQDGQVRGVRAIQRNGVRVGYSYINGLDLVSEYSPHMFVIGYEMNQVYGSEGPMNLLLIANGVISGLNQALFIPSANVITGVELGGSLQLGVGLNLSLGDEPMHMIAAVGRNNEVGEFTVPMHLSVIPDPYGMTRVALTTGVNF